jgi:hypothetical protein
VYIGIREAQPGMTLAEGVDLPMGIGTIPKSQQLTDETIKLLVRAGITRLNIIDPI